MMASGVRWTLVVWLVMLTVASSRVQAAFTDLYVFGDSFSDTGNVYAATFGLIPSDPPYDRGRFTNGTVWVEYLAESLNVPLIANGANPQLVNGNNFAAGGARAAVDTPVPLLGTIPSVRSQAMFVINALTTVSPTSLYVINGGYNDVNLASDPAEMLTMDQQETIVAEAARGIGQTIETLALAGAQSFLVPNLADFGLTPESQARQNSVRARELTERFNAELDQTLGQLVANQPITLYRLDLFRFADDVVADAAMGGSVYGITNVTDPLFSDAGAGLDPETVLFVDSIHVSAAAHRYLGLAAARAVPEPSVWSGLGFGMLALLRLRRAGSVPASLPRRTECLEASAPTATFFIQQARVSRRSLRAPLRAKRVESLS
jgi:phospholipase/lecithinase/hemolysin